MTRFYPPVNDSPAAKVDLQSAGLAEQFAPPPVATSLPPVIPPQTLLTPVAPIAAASARQGSRTEAMLAEDDLDALAAKIKFILDEQARRHGIDV